MRVALVALAVLAGQPALAAKARPVSVEALARDADAVVEAQVEGKQSRWAADRRHLYTVVTLRVVQALRGKAPARLVVRVPGGMVGDIGQHVDAAAEFSAGERAVVFLRRHRGGLWRVHGSGLGKFRIEGSQALPSTEGISFADGTVAPGERLVEPMPLEELKRRVRGVP